MLRQSAIKIFSGICIAASSHAYSREAVSKRDIIGNWRWEDAGLKSKGSFSKLEILPNGKIVGLSFLSGAFSAGGEALESGYGSYKLNGSSIRIRAPLRTEIDGWPDRDGTYHQISDCRISIDSSRDVITLSLCPLSGVWTKIPSE